MTTSQRQYHITTFGCQMNKADSERMAGILEDLGFQWSEDPNQADLILYNTCSIRDKAEQKVFHRLADFRSLQQQGKRFGVLGCVAQQEGERIFERAPHVSLGAAAHPHRADLHARSRALPRRRRHPAPGHQ